MPTLQSEGFDPVAITALAMPSTNWAQRRQDKQMQALYARETASIKEMEIQQQRQQEADLAAAIESFNNLGFDEIGQRQVSEEVNRIVRGQAAKKFKEEYGSDPQKWLQRGEGLALADSLKAFKSSPVFQKVLQNQWKQYQFNADAKSGLLDRPVTWQTSDGETKSGTMAEQLADYRNGKVAQLNYNGGYAVPKNFGKEIQDTFFTGDRAVTLADGTKGYATRYGVLDASRKKVLSAVPVDATTAQAEWARLGGNPADFADYVRRNGGSLRLNYKADNFDDYLKEQEQQRIARENLGVSQANLGIQRQRLNLAERKFAASEAQNNGNVDVLSQVFSQYGDPSQAPRYQVIQNRNGKQEVNTLGGRFNTGTFKDRFAALYGVKPNGNGGYNGRLDRSLFPGAVMFGSNRPLATTGRGAYDFTSVLNDARILDIGGEVVVDNGGLPFVKSTVAVPQDKFNASSLSKYEKQHITERVAPWWQPDTNSKKSIEDQMKEAPKEVVFDLLLPFDASSPLTNFGLQQNLNKNNREYLLEDD